MQNSKPLTSKELPNLHEIGQKLEYAKFEHENRRYRTSLRINIITMVAAIMSVIVSLISLFYSIQ